MQYFELSPADFFPDCSIERMLGFEHHPAAEPVDCWLLRYLLGRMDRNIDCENHQEVIPFWSLCGSFGHLLIPDGFFDPVGLGKEDQLTFC